MSTRNELAIGEAVRESGLSADTLRGSYGGESHGKQATPLHLAAASGKVATVKVLLGAGADPEAVDGHGYGTPANWARHDGHEDIAELLEDSR